MMFYQPGQDHGLPHNPFNAIVAPRPIGWISTKSKEGIANLAPYSFFNAVAYFPPQVMFSSTSPHTDGGPKDSLRNIEETGVFCVNIATESLKDAVNQSSVPAPHSIDEFEFCGLEKGQATLIDVDYVKASPIHLECRHTQTVLLPDDGNGAMNHAVFGTVIGIRIDETILVNGKIAMEKLRPLSRLGYRDFTVIKDTFEMFRPDWP